MRRRTFVTSSETLVITGTGPYQLEQVQLFSDAKVVRYSLVGTVNDSEMALHLTCPADTQLNPAQFTATATEYRNVQGQQAETWREVWTLQ